MHKLVGTTIRATNRTFGLAPARSAGAEETVETVVDPYTNMVKTVEGNVYDGNGEYMIMRYREDHDG